MKYERMKTFTLIFAFYIVHFSKAFINPGVGIGLPSGFKIPSLGGGGYVSSVYNSPAEEEYVVNDYSSYKSPSYSSSPSSSYKAPSSTSYKAPSYSSSPTSSYTVGSFSTLFDDPPLPSVSYVKYERDAPKEEVGKPLYYGDTFDPIQIYKDPSYLYQSPIGPTAGPANRFTSDSVSINAPIVNVKGEPMLQAVRNPFVEDVLIVEEEKISGDDPEPDAEPVVSSFVEDDTKVELAALTLDPDDPFEPEAEVDIETTDFLPSINPLAVSSLSFPTLNQIPTTLHTHSISQTLELLPPTFLENVRRQQKFEDSIADLREDIGDVDHKQIKREHTDDETDGEARELFSDPQYNKDKIHAYNIYKNQWTTSGNKKLVVDASRALQRYYRQNNLLEGGDRQFSHLEHVDNNIAGADIENYLQTERDTHSSAQAEPSPFSLFTLTPEGPRMPFMSTLISDMRNLMSQPIFPKTGSDMMFSLREIMHNMRNAHGDNRFDIYDWIPLFTVLFATALILNGLFPNSIFLGGSGLTFGRSEGARRLETTEDPLDVAINQLENGVLLMSAIRDGGQCSAKLACKLGEMAKNSFENTNMIIDAVSFIAPSVSSKYSNFTETFSSVARSRSRSEHSESCSAECSKCLVI